MQTIPRSLLVDETLALLVASEIPSRAIDLRTILYWLNEGWTPEQIVTDIYAQPLRADGKES